MNKLVSKNPVQRFKQGQKIQKFKEAGIISYKGRDNKDYEAFSGPKGWYYREKGSNQILSMPKNYVTTTGIRFYDTNGNMINNPSTTVPITKKSFQKGFLGDDVEKAPAGIIVKGGSNREKRITPSRVTNRVLPKYSGVDLQGKTVGEWQNILKDYYAPGTYKNDGIWGDNTENAYRAYLEKQKLEHPTLDNLQLPTSILSPISNNISNMKIKVPQQTYNRSQIREFMRNKGVNPYSFNGAQRRALRMVLNGTADDNDKLLVKEMGIFKKGGQLPSRNVVKRFKQKNFR